MPRTGWLWSVHVQIDHNRILSVPHDHSFADLIRTGIDLLMRHVRWNVNKVAWPSFFAQFQLIRPNAFELGPLPRRARSPVLHGDAARSWHPVEPPLCRPTACLLRHLHE